MNKSSSIKLGIRKVCAEDAHLINRYWSETTDKDLERLGELGRPDAQGNIEFIKEFCGSPLDQKSAAEDIRIWCVDDEPIGYSTLKDIKFGSEGQAKTFRRHGYGSILFCLSAATFFKEFHLKDLYCQPKRDNPMPNGMLRKIGFPELGPVEYQRRDSSIIIQSRFHILPSIIERYLRSAPKTITF